MSVPHEMFISFSKPLSQNSIVSLHTQKRERGGGESEIGREGEKRREIVSVSVMFSLTLAIWEHSDIALLH